MTLTPLILAIVAVFSYLFIHFSRKLLILRLQQKILFGLVSVLQLLLFCYLLCCCLF